MNMERSYFFKNASWVGKAERTDDGLNFKISIPEGCRASFRIHSYERELCAGENVFSISEKVTDSLA